MLHKIKFDIEYVFLNRFIILKGLKLSILFNLGCVYEDMANLG